jgi:Ca2+-binding EF-hand superfamily protein
MAEQDWGDEAAYSYDAGVSSEAAAYAGYYAEQQGDPNEYWRVDVEVYPVFLALAPSAQGESVELGQLPELCRQVGRPLRDDHEQFRLMQELDTTNSMLVLRHDFVAWLLSEIHAEERARIEAEPRAIPVATPAWEEVVQEVAEADLVLGSKPSVFYYNTLSGESMWELPGLVRCLWTHLESLEAAQQEAQVARDGVPAFVKPRRGDDDDSSDDAREVVQQLRELFIQYDDDKSGYLDPAEFEDLCVRVGQPVNGREGLLALMQEANPFSSPGQQVVVSWEALRHYWVANAPFQRRTRLGETRYASWERVEHLSRRTTPVLFRHTSSLQERWGHPALEQRVADRLSHLFPSSKLDWAQKIDLFLDVQWQQQQQGSAAAEGEARRFWSLETCWRVFAQLDHPMCRRQHVTAVVGQLQHRFGGSAASESAGTEGQTLDQAAVRAWLQYCTRKVDLGGWEEVVDAEGQTYYYHEVDGVTQWDPPQLQTQMATMLNKLGGGQQNLPADEQIARVFRQYDADESGEMTLDEFQRFYRALLGRGNASGGAVSDAQIRQVFGVLDASGDGAVTLEEFQLWWTTKLQLEVKQTTEAETSTREQRRRDVCREFLANADALVLVPAATAQAEGGGGARETEEAFESNLLPRLVALLGEFPLRGLAYRRALNELVADPMEQLVALERFLDWYDGFESAEREKMELQRARQRAQAELRAQHEAQAAAREKQRRRRKQLRTLNVMNEQATAVTNQEAELQREKKVAVLFKSFDTDGSGLLDESELLQLTKALGHEMDAAQVSRMMKAMDSSGDGRINLDEFLAFWKAFEHRRPADAALLHQTRRDAVSEPAKAAEAAPAAQHLTKSDAIASLAVSFEMVKDRALKLTLADMRGFLTDWRDDLLDKRIEQQANHDDAETLKKLREARVFVPTKKRVYGAKRLDVTWIEPEVVACVAAIIADIGAHLDPPLKPDAAQQIQALVRGHLGRKHVLARVHDRFQRHVDPHTRLFYFVDSLTSRVLLARPLYPTSTSCVAPFERGECTSKADMYQFDKRLVELAAKKLFYDRVCLPSASSQHRPMLAPSAFYMYDVAAFVQQRLLGNIWTSLRSSRPELALVELIARRRRRQLMQRGRDAAANLPLHYALRHAHFTVGVVRAMVKGYPEALAQCDAFGMTPLHIAFRERRSSIQLLQLLARRSPRPSTFSRTRQAAGKKARTLGESVHCSVWARQTVCGDTPLHVAVLHRASVGVLQWALQACAGEIKAALPKLFNERGESAFHSCIAQQQQRLTSELLEGSDFTSPRSRTAVQLFFKYVDTTALCATATKCGDLPLHLAMDAFELQKQRATEASTPDSGAGWLWLVDLLLTHYPAAVLTPKRSNGLLPVHLAIKYGFAEELAVKIFVRTAETLQQPGRSAPEQQTLAAATTIAGTRTTLLHYALVHQPRATGLLLLLISRMPTLCSTSSLATGDLPIHVAAAAPGLSTAVLLKLCEVYNEGCRTYNAKRHLPLHVTLTQDVGNVEKAMVLLQQCQEMLLADTEERCGLRALLMAANAKTPDHRALTTLLDVAPSRKLATPSSKRTRRSPPVTPLYALSLRRCTPEITAHDVAKRCHDKFEGLEDGEAYFLAMAKAKLRRQHYNPTPQWTFAEILELVERNPLDEALIQRALHATNEKLRAMVEADKQETGSNQDDTRSGFNKVVDSVTLNSDLLLVRAIHQIMYEFPANPRLQLLGQAVLSKLLPSAYVRAAYKAKIDPYCNL